MKIVFLGTGHGIPTPERYCTAALIEINEAIYYIDAGAPLFERTEAAGFDPTRVRALFTTHAHGDHIAGVYAFADLMNWAKRFAETECNFFMTEEGVADAMKALISLTAKPLDESRLHFNVASEGTVYKDENVSVSYIPTKHMAAQCRPSYAILIEGEGKRVLFSGDMSQHLAEDDFPKKAYESLDLFVCELAHFSVDELAPYLSEVGARIVAFSHVYPIEKYGEIEALRGKYSFELLTPSDMSEIIL